MLPLQKRFEKGTENYELFNDYWKLRQQYYEPDNDDEWFEELREAGEKIIKKYQSTELAKLARNLVLSHFEDVEDRWKEKRQKLREGQGKPVQLSLFDMGKYEGGV